MMLVCICSPLAKLLVCKPPIPQEDQELPYVNHRNQHNLKAPKGAFLVSKDHIYYPRATNTFLFILVHSFT